MISVVIPCYNCKSTVLRTVESVINQTENKVIGEIILVNDGSTDDTLEFLYKIKEMYNNFNIIVLDKKNGGVASARNFGMINAKYEWIALVDSDDTWGIDKIKEQCKYLSNPNIKFLGTNRNDENLKFGKRIEENLFSLKIYNLVFKPWPHPSTVLINKDVVDKVGLFDDSRTHAEDGEYWNRVANFYDLYYISKSLVECGDGKRSFGESGLSANLKKMHEGNLLNFKIAYKNKQINILIYLLACVYETVKYCRRILITRFF